MGGATPPPDSTLSYTRFIDLTHSSLPLTHTSSSRHGRVISPVQRCFEAKTNVSYPPLAMRSFHLWISPDHATVLCAHHRKRLHRSESHSHPRRVTSTIGTVESDKGMAEGWTMPDIRNPCSPTSSSIIRSLPSSRECLIISHLIYQFFTPRLGSTWR